MIDYMQECSECQEVATMDSNSYQYHFIWDSEFIQWDLRDPNTQSKEIPLPQAFSPGPHRAAIHSVFQAIENMSKSVLPRLLLYFLRSKGKRPTLCQRSVCPAKTSPQSRPQTEQQHQSPKDTQPPETEELHRRRSWSCSRIRAACRIEGLLKIRLWTAGRFARAE